MGKYGIAEEAYEKIILEPLLKTNTLNSVEFTGVMGAEKKEIIKKSKVAVAPNDKETFCISALEYNLSGVPVVGIAKGGINDVVINKKTGFLYKTNKGIEKGIIDILLNKKNIDNLPNGIEYFQNNFSVSKFVDKWIKLINEVDNDLDPSKIKAKKPFDDKYKWAGIILMFFRKVLHLPDFFSRVGIAAEYSKRRKHG